MGVASFFVVGMSANAFSNYKELRISPSHKHQVIQDWGYEKKDRIGKTLTEQPIAFHAQSFKDIRHEGLGVNHDEWKKTKQNE
jgi:hypothetical protein